MRIGSVVCLLVVPFLAGCAERPLRKEILRVEVGDLLRNPVSYAGREVLLSGMYGVDEVSGETCFRLFPFDAPVWKKGSGRGVQVCREVSPFPAYRPYESLEVRGRVHFAEGSPLRVEAGGVRRRGDPLFGIESLSLMVDGFSETNRALARDKLERALRGALSPSARYHVHMKAGGLCEKNGAYADAMLHFQRADDYTPHETEKEAARKGYQRSFRLEKKRRHIEEMGEED